MKERQSRIPQREIVDRRESGPGSRRPARRRARRLFLPLLIIGLAVGLYLRDAPESFLTRFLEPVRGFFSGWWGETAPEQADPRSRELSPVVDDTPPPAVDVQTTPDAGDRVESPEAEEFVISIGVGFRPVGFQMGATPGQVDLGSQPDRPLRHSIAFEGVAQKYGVFRLGGRQYAFVLDTAPAGYRLYLDRNGNRNLDDDGPPLVNRGKGLFANSFELPLTEVSNIPRLRGRYRLWLFTTPGSWSENRLNYYSMTQLQGQLEFRGKRYIAYLADNLQVDGDYTNDGISIDLDASGSIEPQAEFFAPGEAAVVDGRAYRFRVVR
jgi:hypothetical protein